MDNMSTVTIALLDDHPVLVRGLKNMLESIAWLNVTGAYNSVSECLTDFAQKNLPQILLMDVFMPDKNGEELAVIIKRNYPEVALIAFTNLEQRYYINSLLAKGVSGYVIKSSSEDILVEAIRTVAAGGIYFDPLIEPQAMEAIKIKKSDAAGKLVLTPREKEILKLLADNCSSSEIAEKLYISKRTVDFHRANLLLKFDVKNSIALVKKAIELRGSL
ncbi:response regulator [Taibaiella chishuiensis]|uniref:LuxR family two component transcriptional regulator n=1 Tax=Taibaiella chishuiensis TaxID=1434707 RepID=A0A2P8D7I3_9BACT|nr:response regulator transcription factor [Taibaiella chishuiensis]PSK93168.1 LuxR family two component transcriptional regulator [Taibaiella chishuiensis]